ncbi:hypothetical protein O181_008988 [Austropuccinia psidii MF-1]|uniref:Uncharacterized protein n=1 Tax=Austropuccinia psidii MF-1 TaxID=1389203 RepID=A0A9Q3BQH6_9BASI|nr:hypothetical protein [Austropuccinia psidii MF-1]
MRGVQQWNNTTISWANIGVPIHHQGNCIGVAPEVLILVTRKDGRLIKLKSTLVVQSDVDDDSEGGDEIDGEELELSSPIHRGIIQSIKLSPVQAITTTAQVMRSPQPPQPPHRSQTRSSTLASTSTNLQPPMARASRDPMSSDPG